MRWVRCPGKAKEQTLPADRSLYSCTSHFSPDHKTPYRRILIRETSKTRNIWIGEAPRNGGDSSGASPVLAMRLTTLREFV